MTPERAATGWPNRDRARPLCTLVVEDDPDVAELLRVTFSSIGHTVVIARDGRQAVREALAVRPDLVLLDGAIPGMSGAAICRALRSDFATATAGIIFVTGRHATADVIVGLEAGADDYMTKPFDSAELIARAESVLRRSAEMRGLSPLTGLPGNFVILREIERLVAAATPFSLIYADLDNFKAYNDHYGFLRGDEALRATARVLTTALAQFDSEPRFVGHIGGDDFALLVANSDAEALAQEIANSFDAVAPDLYDDIDVISGHIQTRARDRSAVRHPLLTISMGIATTRVRAFASPHEAVAVATEVKRLAKQSALSCWQIDRRE